MFSVCTLDLTEASPAGTRWLRSGEHSFASVRGREGWPPLPVEGRALLLLGRAPGSPWPLPSRRRPHSYCVAMGVLASIQPLWPPPGQEGAPPESHVGWSPVFPQSFSEPLGGDHSPGFLPDLF